jgi:uncharacterized RDD family membrane protein YckC
MSEHRFPTLSVHTPEGLAFSLRLAGPVVRFLAWLTDQMCVMALTKLLYGVISLFGMISQDLHTAMAMMVYYLVSLCYGFLLEWYMNGQTLGKRLLGLRVMDAQGLNLSFSQVVIRNLLRFVDMMPALYMVGGVSALLTAKVQRLGDLAANTIVVWAPRVDQPDFSQVFADKYNSFRTYPHLCARLRQSIRPAEADLALQALLRRETLDPTARISLFKTLADYFRSKMAFPQEATDGLSDEQYTRNLVDVLFRPDR